MSSSPTITPDTTVVLATGWNPGFGLEIVNQVTGERPDYHVILSSRRPAAVMEAAAPFQARGPRVSNLLLDATSGGSIQAAAQIIGAEFDHLDVLIDNSSTTGYQVEPLRERMQADYNANFIGTALVADTKV